jgi:hypothetical protein
MLRKPKAVLDAEIQQRGVTADGLLRHASYKGVRERRGSPSQ